MSFNQAWGMAPKVKWHQDKQHSTDMTSDTGFPTVIVLKAKATHTTYTTWKIYNVKHSVTASLVCFMFKLHMM